MNKTTESIYRRMVVLGAEAIQLADQLPQSQGARVVAGQLSRSATSVGANYRESQRARTKAEFVSKLQISLQEADETIHWLEVIKQARLAKQERIGALLAEANELTAILVTSVRTTKSRA